MSFFLQCCVVCLALCFVTEVYSLIELDDETFKGVISTSNENSLWIIDFYAVSDLFRSNIFDST